MKGIIFNLFEEFVVETFGAEAWEDILEASPHDARAVRVGPATYPDAHLFMIAEAACKKANLSLEVALRAFGKFLFFGLGRKYPSIVKQFPDAQSLLKGIDSVIHVEVNKLLPGSVTPTILCTDDGQGGLTLTYDSARRLCPLLEGLLDGLSEHSHQRIERTHDICQHKGAPRCELKLTFHSLQQRAA
jgi:hypothetical protein